MARADAGSVVAVKVLVEVQQVAPVRIALKLFGSPEYRPAIAGVAQKYARQPLRQFVGGFVEREETARPVWTFNFEVVSVVVMEFLERLDNQIIDGEPDWSAPIGVSAEQAGMRLCGLVRDPELPSVVAKHVRADQVIAREGSYSV